MKKTKLNILSLALIISILSSACKQREGVEITGTLTNSQGEKIVLQELTVALINPIDSIYLDEDGKFAFETKISSPGFFRLQLNPNNYIILILDSLEEIQIEGDARNLANTYTVKGSRDSEMLWEMNKYLKENYQFRDSLQQVFQQYINTPEMDSVGAALESQYNKSVENLQNYIKDFIDRNPHSFASLAAIEQLSPDTDFSYFIKLSESLSEKHPKSEYVKAFSNRVDELKRTAIGSPAPEIKMNNPEGKTISLSDFKGKIILVDFWAAWCKPCRMENPNVVKLYKRFKDKGFEILGVSLDRDREAWVEAIKEDGLTWPQVSDLMFWSSPVVKQYGFQGIPYTVLVDREGKILAKNLRGEELERKLEEILK
jgi:peroxiredoxin